MKRLRNAITDLEHKLNPDLMVILFQIHQRLMNQRRTLILKNENLFKENLSNLLIRISTPQSRNHPEKSIQSLTTHLIIFDQMKEYLKKED